MGQNNKGVVLTRIDPTTSTAGPSVALPSINNGRWIGSQGALFYFDAGSDKGYYRLTTGATAMESFGRFSH